jgi:hypothetical protein
VARSAIEVFANFVLIAYLVYRAFTTFLIMPLVALPWSLSGAYFVVLFVFAVAIAVMSFRGTGYVVVPLAGVFAAIALSYWWLIVCRGGAPIWSDFGWLVLPEVCFAAAAVCRSLASPAGRVAAGIADRAP